MIFGGITILFDACKKSDEHAISSGYHPTYLTFKIPAGWPTPPIDIFKNNPLTEEGFQLGKKLFYDGRLSKDGNFPCASCHQQFAAFSTYDHQFSHGFNNSFTFRNAPPLFNLAWMNENLLKKLSIDTAYPRMFAAAFGDTTINSQRMLKALSQFMGSIQSFNSKYDQVKRGEASFTVAEQNGYTTFKAKCNSCHTEPLFTDNSFRNNGLSIDPFLKDIGRMRITGKSSDSIVFKVPSLRNIQYTGPYMHDGRIFSLLQVVSYYQTGIDITQPTLDPLLKNRLSFTNQEKVDLIEFLQTLTDDVLLHDNRLSQSK